MIVPPAPRLSLSMATKIVLGVTVLVLIIWATVAAVFGAEGSTISEHVRDYAAAYPLIPFALGVVCGHWFWTMKPAQRPFGGPP